MKRISVAALAVILSALCLTGCRSVKQAGVKADTNRTEYIETARRLLSAPSVTEFTTPATYGLSGNKVGGQIRMRRDQSIQLGVSVLIADVARVEFLPDRVVITDRVHSTWAVCHYADIPYRNELGLDFEVIQAIMWNRMFVPGCSDADDAAFMLNDVSQSADGIVTYREKEYGYLFTVNANGDLVQTSNASSHFSFRIDYSDFQSLAEDYRFPKTLTVTVTTSARTLSATLEMTSPNTQIRTWANETPVSSRFKRVTLDELLDGLDI